MRKSLLILCCLGLGWFAQTGGGTPERVLRDIRGDYFRRLAVLEQAIQHYAAVADATNDSTELRTAHLNARMAFKSVSFLLTFFEPERDKYFLNAAPLPYASVKNREVIIMQPVGLQVLDELVFEENPLRNQGEILDLIEKLIHDTQAVLSAQKSQALSHQEVFEAMRMELLRVFSLGLTGFDTPGSLNAIPEAAASLTALRQTLEKYEVVCDKPAIKIFKRINKKFHSAILYLEKNEDFDGFDRLFFLKEYLNPLYAGLLDLHGALGAEYFDEEDVRPAPINYHAANIFDDDLLNPIHFLGSELNTPLGKERVELGKRLFYDENLSDSKEMSCASCHQPSKAFSDGLAKSIGNDGITKLERNAPTLINSVFATRYFYDLRERILENQIGHVVVHPKEFNTDFASILRYLESDPSYVSAFQSAYQTPSKSIATQHFNNALASYVASLRSFDSPFDRHVRNESGGDIIESAKRGFNLFMGKAACGTCHFAPLFNGLVPPGFNDTESEVLGVPVEHDTLRPILDADKGRRLSGLPIDDLPFREHAFKTVTIRNAALTAPYMHNGAYRSLEDVVDFYDRGGGAGMGLDVPNQTLSADPLGLTEREKKDLVAFMESLSEPASAFEGM